MVRIWIFAVMTVVVLLSLFGCGQQGAGDTTSGSTDATTSPGRSGERATTTEQPTYVEMYGLQCRSGDLNAAVFDYARGAKGEKASPVELAQGDFSKSIEESDTMEIADREKLGPYTNWTVSVVRDGRVVALIKYGRVGGGWVLSSYEACADPNIKPNWNF
jgi:hypothetical protein